MDFLSKRDAKIWEAVAADYINFTRKEQKAYLRHLIYESLFSSIFSLSGDLRGKMVLDAGCGEGRLARLLAKNGARVHGCDVSKTMITEAKKIELKEPLNIRYFIHDLTEKLPENKLFDLVVCNLVLFNIHNLEQTLKNLSRVIRKSGGLIISIMHPCFNSTQSQRFNLRFIGRHGGKISFEIKKSYKEPNSYKAEYRFKKIPLSYYHRPLETYFKSLSENQLYVNGLIEPVLKLNEIYDEKTYHQHFLPKFIIIKAFKNN